ncbi:MAG TPA: SET domain-containing protein-lysine N-methyltransferase [Gemmataceae bacterium]|jgi:SET domain-containing protein
MTTDEVVKKARSANCNPQKSMSHHQFVTRSDLVEIRDADGMGRGVFAATQIPADTLLFSDPLMMIPEEQCPVGSLLDTIVFMWSVVMEDGLKQNALALGMGTVLNHSKLPNVIVYFEQNPDRLDFYALRDIEPGEQLTHDYNYDEYPAGWKA